jgi:membrane carboxypeptidase/penicillin-binding protein PbpC
VKAAYLAADSSTPDATKGMDAVFSVTDKMGVKFPCIPTTDGAKCNDPSTAEKAYRSRCGVASALGGCEITMLSHATGINTFAQSGKLRTATPFKQILSPDGRDIYSEKQKSEQIYKQNDKAIDPAIANQINSILSDYNARRPAFGNLSRRLELNGWSGANAVAAKTGTTNDIKDTWTVGYSPYYTVVVWVGNTDSKPLNPRANSVGTTSGIWNDIMVSLHANKEKKGFSKDGLIAIRIDPATGLPVDEGGSVEWMTKAQSDRLAKAKDNFNQNDYQPTEKTFLQNGTVVVPRKLKINRVDGKLAVEGKTLPENIEEKEFRELVAEYPKWQDTADRLMENSQAYQKAPREVSDQDQVADRAKVPTFTSNLDTNTKDVSSISVTAQVQGDQTKTIKSIEILINGTRVVNSTGQSSVNYDKVDSYTGINNTVLIRVTDSLGAISEKTYQNVSFQTKVSSATPLTNSDLASLNVVCEKSATNATDCTFTLPSGKTLPTTFRLRIGTTGNGSSCTENDENVTCSNVSIPGSGSYPIQAKITGNFVNTRSMYNSSSGN